MSPIEVHACGRLPKAPYPLVDPLGYAAEQDRLRRAYAEALLDDGVPPPI